MKKPSRAPEAAQDEGWMGLQPSRQDQTHPEQCPRHQPHQAGMLQPPTPQPRLSHRAALGLSNCREVGLGPQQHLLAQTCPV